MPHETLSAQVSSAESLLHDIDPVKAYPLELIIYRITGYRPKQAPTDLLTGMALQHDLGLLIERMSEVLDLAAAGLSEPVLSIDDVTERFNVTSKTIQRWRRRGLPARRFLFGDGKRRVGFLLSSVERFFVSHRAQVVRDTNLSQVDGGERDAILRRARLLAGDCGCCIEEITRRIAKKYNRSPLTILHTIRRHDQENPDDAIFACAAEPICDEVRARILRAHRHGIAIKSLSRKYRVGRAEIYRVIMNERIARMNRRKIKFIDDPLYHQDDARDAVEAIVAAEDIGASASGEELRIPRDLPPYLQDLYRTPLLTPARERALFLLFNLHKYQFVQSRRRLEPQFACSRDLDVMEGHLRRTTETKNAIVRANLRLVVSVARKHLRPGMNLMELISDGNITLMRAVESFDTHKGHRFSTYATLALMKGFARSVPQMLFSNRGTSSDAVLSEVADVRHEHMSDRVIQRDEVRQLLGRLDERERTVLLAHYGLNDEAAASTYEEVAQRMGLSKQRVRQIEQGALEKLRAGAR